jgi:hypothetical protein
MLKDVVVNLSGRTPRDFAAEYAISIAATFGAHITGISFVYEPVIPDGTLGGVPADLIELQREENSKVANQAVSRFDAGIEKAGISAETRVLDATFGGAATRFAQIARRFDPRSRTSSPRSRKKRRQTTSRSTTASRTRRSSASSTR